MNRGRSAPSARSDTSEMDTEGAGNVVLLNTSHCRHSPPIVYVDEMGTTCVHCYSNRIRNYQTGETVEDHGRKSAYLQLSDKGADPQTTVSERCVLRDFLNSICGFLSMTDCLCDV